MNRNSLVLFLSLVFAAADSAAQEKVGKRPYEMEWAGRTEDTRPALVDFENLEGWRVETTRAEAKFERAREQQLWGRYVAKLTYRGESADSTIILRPPAPIPIEKDFDCVNFWVYGNNWDWMPVISTPQVVIEILFRDRDGREVPVEMGRVRWEEWWLMHTRLSPQQIKALSGRSSLAGIRVSNASNREDRVLFFDNLTVYKEELKPLVFQPRPARNLTLFPGQSPGANTGPGRLPFPTREETILPTNLETDYKTLLEERDGCYVFTYRDRAVIIAYTYKPETGRLDDVLCECPTLGYSFRPMAGGGLFFHSPDGPQVPPDEAQLIECKVNAHAVEAKWKLSAGARSAVATYAFRLWQKSLIVDVMCQGGQIGSFRIGAAAGAPQPRLVTIPYMGFSNFSPDRPAVLVMGEPDKPLFLSGLLDWYRSNASQLFASIGVTDAGAAYNGGSLYRHKTDGTYNDCFERLFLTASQNFEEVLPNIPNPKSPWMHVAGERLWHAHGATDRQRDYALWKGIARHGMTKLVITDHETGWRDGGESFTFRVRTAPGKGGDESQKWYADALHRLGFVYGIYNNYTDFAPVNEFWDEDCVTRNPDGQWRTAWPRCYNPKPARAVEFEARLAPIIKSKFTLSTAYCDVHTAVSPWDYVDYDHRVPGAGTFAATFYAYGEIMLHQKQTWNGPVYSEGGQHWYYCGLTDGNYGQDVQARLPWNPWLVEFDLRKLHPLCCNFGMGNIEMFYGYGSDLGRTPEEREFNLDRFLAATVAFGHTGYLVRDGGMRNTARSYFMLQQLHKHYAQETAEKILYADENGNWLPATQAVANGAFARSQIATTYSNGLLTLANGNRTEWLKYRDGDEEVTLPPNGYYGRLKDKDGRTTLLVVSGFTDGHRSDYAETPEYIFADGRDVFTRFPRAAADKALIALLRPDGKVEVIPVAGCSVFAVGLGGRAATAEALNEEGDVIGRAAARLSRGLCYITPVENAFSYLLTPKQPQTPPLECSRQWAVPGETVEIKGKKTWKVEIPKDAQPGELLWRQFEGSWIDFPIRPLADVGLRFAESGLEVAIKSNLGKEAQAEISSGGIKQKAVLPPGVSALCILPLKPPSEPGVKTLPLSIKAAGLSLERTFWIRTRLDHMKLAELPARFETLMQIRGQPEAPMDASSGANAHEQKASCGGVEKKAIVMHPPWTRGVGYSALVYAPLALPPAPPAAFRCLVGKRDGSYLGDGLLYILAVIDESGAQTEAARVRLQGHKWLPLEADLSRWAGRRIRLKLIADVGENDDSSGDWAAWAEMRIESLSPVLIHEIDNTSAKSGYVRGPFHHAGARIADVRNAKRAWLRFKGCGIEGTEEYALNAYLNDVPLGRIPTARGNEAKGEWSEVRIPIPPQALRTLAVQNVVRIENAGKGDFYKVKDFWIEVELAPGRPFSSMITTAVFTQPPGWLYSEGTSIPFDEAVKTEVRFEISD